MKYTPVPVFVFHSVRPASIPWKWGYLSCPPTLFESYLRSLKAKGYESVLLSDVVQYNLGEMALSKRSVAITFDDGYLDNWTVVVPLLKKYGFRGTLFVSPEFVDPRNIVRPQVSPGREITREHVEGFVSWDELKAAQDEGVLDVQSHGMTHTWYPSSGEIVDFHHPGDGYPWLAWNARPDRKHLWNVEDQSQFVPYGTPVYAHSKSLIAKRYFEPQEPTEKLVRFVKDEGGVDFFQQSNWREILHEQARSCAIEGRLETDDEYHSRVFWELDASKKEIESRLNKPVEYLCWPGGGYNEMTIEFARRARYVSWDEREGPNGQGALNYPGKKIEGFGRTWVPVLNVGRFSSFANRLIFRYKLEIYRDSPGWRSVRGIVTKVNNGLGLPKRALGLKMKSVERSHKDE